MNKNPIHFYVLRSVEKNDTLRERVWSQVVLMKEELRLCGLNALKEN